MGAKFSFVPASVLTATLMACSSGPAGADAGSCGSSICDPNASCITPGGQQSPYCVCDEGFNGNGLACKGNAAAGSDAGLDAGSAAGNCNCNPDSSTPQCTAPSQRGTSPTSTWYTCPDNTICDLHDVCVSPQYSDNQDGTVTDNVTGLVWQQDAPNPCPQDAVDAGVEGVCSWVDANAYCAGLNLGAFPSGWRLPTLAELFSLVDYSGSSISASTGIAIDAAVFSVPSNAVWTSSLFIGSARVVDFQEGWTGIAPFLTAGFSVRCVH